MARTTTLQERVTISELAQAGHTDAQIAAEMDWQLPTVRKWRRRAKRQGRQGLASQLGRPARGALSSYPAVLRETL